ncbi:MAG: hypothetical protein HC866_14730 [Leptolyngbyaceae cyanobacterium RU_5_1]|nr:hypothetical protein [Leptolyngbyaceae cyanobacterium RU_5_1]
MNMRILSVLGAAGLMVGFSLPAGAVPSATTRVLDKETLTGIEGHDLPTPPVHPALFTLPIDVQVVKNDTITTDTPITDKFGVATPVADWATAVRACLYAKPKLVRVVGKDSVPFVINKNEGTVVLNANGKAVCPQ